MFVAVSSSRGRPFLLLPIVEVPSLAGALKRRSNVLVQWSACQRLTLPVHPTCYFLCYLCIHCNRHHGYHILCGQLCHIHPTLSNQVVVSERLSYWYVWKCLRASGPYLGLRFNPYPFANFVSCPCTIHRIRFQN